MTKHILILFAACLTAFATYATAPTITSFTPASGPVGILVTITGTNLSSPTAFTIGGVSAIAVSNTGTTLVGLVMPGAATGTVSVTTSGGNDTGSVHFTITPTSYPHTQQGSKLVGTGAVGAAWQCYSVAISADGRTAIVGAISDSSGAGAAWVYARSGTTWTQQGAKLVGTGAVNGSTGAGQGASVSISADGNTAIVGGYSDSSGRGAAWVYARSGTTWTQQGPKLVGTGAVNGFNGAYQGRSVSLSADGNTAIVGGVADNNGAGAAWVYTRSGTTWTQQGLKLVGTGASGAANQGVSASLSADGSTAIVGGAGDNSAAGAAWVYTRSGTTWTQQGSKLVGTGAINGSNGARQGWSVSLSADGNTAIVGGLNDNNYAGAAWVYSRSGATWTQQGSKLVGTGGIGPPYQGASVSLSADGGRAIVGGLGDDSLAGAAWIYTRSDTTWTQAGNKLVGTGAINIPNPAQQGYAVSLSADGSTAIVGGPKDNTSAGAAWVYGLSCSPLSSTAHDTIFPGALPYTWNGLTFTGAGSQTAQLLDIAGCDSAATLILTVRPTGISEITGPSPIHLYPNPNTGAFTLQTSRMQNAAYTISDMLGQVIQHEAITSDSQTIDIGAVPTGIYMLSITGTSGMVKFVVMR